MRLTFDEKQSTIEVIKTKIETICFRAEIAKRETVCSQANGYISEMEVPSAFEKKERFALHRWIREAVRLLV